MENKRITLRELKAMLPSTRGKGLPTPKQLRENDKMIVAASTLDSSMEVFQSGFAIYRTPHHYAVIRMEHVGQATYQSEQDDWTSTVSVEDEDWTIGVMLCGEDRLERMYQISAGANLMSLTGNSPDEEGADMEFDAGVDVLKEVVFKDEYQRILDSLTPRQREVVQMLERGMTQKEIADELGIKPPSVTDFLKYAVKKIKKFS